MRSVIGIKSDNLLLIGVDSACLDLVLKWRSYLPNLGILMRRGSFGYLRSTIPPLSAPAWVSMVTGKNPGKTGVFDWVRMPKKAGEKLKIVYLNGVKESKIWDVLGREGMRSCIVNLPLSYPPSKLNGIMVSGIPGHIAGGNITYPPSLKDELDKAVGGYEVHPYTDLRIPGQEAEYITEFERELEKRTRAALYLMEKKQWDFFMVVFYVLDSIQHYFWKHMDRNHPSFDSESSKKFGDVIRKFYIGIDESIGKLINAVGKNTNVILVSDHGMGPLYGRFSINNLFLKEGLLTLKRDLNESSRLAELRESGVKIATNILRRSPQFFRTLATKIFPFEWKENLTLRGRIKMGSEELQDAIDWHKTKAYALGEAGGIFVRDESDCRSVKDLLNKIQYPFGKHESTVKVYEKHKIYEGPYIDVAPDVYCLINGYKMRTDLTSNVELWSPSVISGYHTEQGLFIAAGPDIKSVPSPQHYSIYDIMPTVLMLLDTDLPPDLDGRPLHSITHMS